MSETAIFGAAVFGNAVFGSDVVAVSPVIHDSFIISKKDSGSFTHTDKKLTGSFSVPGE